MTLEDLFSGSIKDITNKLKQKQIKIPDWATLEKEYDPKKHPVMDKGLYPDIVKTDENPPLEKVTRVILDWQRLATKRLTELCFGIPVKRVFKAKTDRETEISNAINAILKKNRIDSMNIERGNYLFGGCEFATLWYTVEDKNNLYGFDSNLKLRCRNYSQMKGDKIYPIFDETDNLIALSFGYTKEEDKKTVEYLDVYTAERHIRYKTVEGQITEDINEIHNVGKIPAVYCYRPTPAWEDTSELIYENEWTLSRNGNFIRKNSKPILALFATEQVDFNKEKDEKKEFRAVVQYPAGSDLKYVTWQQAIESIKFQTESLRKEFFSSLQLPDMSYENMKSTPMSGEARKMMFIDSQLKVVDESGRLLDTFDRELNVIKAFLKIMNPKWAKDIDALQVDTEITPFTINDDKDTISNLMSLTAGKPIMSQREAISQLGWSDDADETYKQIKEEETGDVFKGYE